MPPDAGRPARFRSRLLRLPAGLLVLLLGVGSGLGAERDPAQAERLEVRDQAYVLSRPLGDLYDSALVLTSPGGDAPPRPISLDALADQLLAYDVIFFGEVHGHPAIHLAQLKLLRALYERDPKLLLSLEQFERDVQPVVDDYLAGRIGERALIERGRAWDSYAGAYRPLLAFARDHGLPVIAAEAPTWAISCIGQQGAGVLDRFDAQERGWVAQELHLGAGPYRDRFMKFVGESASHGGGAPSAEAQQRNERSFAAQLARDETMAESLARARQRPDPRRILHLNGTFHSSGFLGTVERLRARAPGLRIAVIDPVEVDDVQAPSFRRAQRADATVLQLVAPLPAPFAEGEDQSAWIRGIMAKRSAATCKYALPTGNAAPAAPRDGPPAGASGSAKPG